MYMLHIHEVRSPAIFLSIALQQHITSHHIVAAQRSGEWHAEGLLEVLHLLGVLSPQHRQLQLALDQGHVFVAHGHRRPAHHPAQSQSQSQGERAG